MAEILGIKIHFNVKRIYFVPIDGLYRYFSEIGTGSPLFQTVKLPFFQTVKLPFFSNSEITTFQTVKLQFFAGTTFFHDFLFLIMEFIYILLDNMPLNNKI